MQGLCLVIIYNVCVSLLDSHTRATNQPESRRDSGLVNGSVGSSVVEVKRKVVWFNHPPLVEQKKPSRALIAAMRHFSV